jgi:hypothetical protein
MMHWRQIHYFGVGDVDRHWFISLLERLADISKVEIEDFLNDYKLRDAYRYHPINWSQTNIPIKKADLAWLGDQIEAEDFELVQFQISTGTGRIVGYFDPSQVFHIVLLDPAHNIQPVKQFDYRVQATHIAECQLSKLTARFQNTIAGHATLSSDQKTEILKEIREQYVEFTGGCVMVDISAQCLDKLYTLAATGVLARIGELIELAIDDFQARHD